MKKIITSIFTFVLVVALSLPGASAKETQIFEDVPTTHPNFNDINYLVEHGVLEKGGKYRPAEMITREEAIVMIAKAVGLDGTPQETKFDDVPKSNINSGYIQSAVEAEIINGSTPYDFMPKAPLTRMQMSVILVRAFQLPLDEVPVGTRLFKDVDYLIYGAPFIQSIVKLGITNGYPDGKFKPHNALTRAHMAAFLTRTMKYVENNS